MSLWGLCRKKRKYGRYIYIYNGYTAFQALAVCQKCCVCVYTEYLMDDGQCSY